MDVKERPILFSGAMVRANREGRKSQTRRGMKTQPSTGQGGLRCPYGQPGERLWARESWAAGKEYDNVQPIDIPADAPIWYLADGSKPDWVGKSRPSIHLPRVFSRDLLKINSIRIERLQEISEQDAIAEGIIKLPATGRFVVNRGDQYFDLASSSARMCYFHLFESINGRGSVETNPWLWVIKYKRITHGGE